MTGILLASLLMAQSPVAIEGKWRVAKMNGKSLLKGVKPPTVEFATQGRVAGFSGCNRFGGSYNIEGMQLKLSELFATRMACAGQGMELEDRFS